MAFSLPLPTLVVLAALCLSACQSSEERAEGHFAAAKALLAQNDEERAIIELRNVFQYDGFHQEARSTYAALLLKRGNLKDAYGQYLRLVEQYPDLVEARLTLAEMALESGDWNEVTRHGQAAIDRAPQDPRARAIGIALAYRQAVLDRDTALRDQQAEAARAMLETLPENLVLRRIVIDEAMNGPDPARALPDIEAALKLAPKNEMLHAMKLRLLGQANDMPAVGAQLKTMVAIFPKATELKQSLIRWFMSQQDTDGAEAFLRAEAGALTAAPEGHLAVVQFLTALRGREAGRAELAKLIAANQGTANGDLYGSFLATMDFEEGRRDEGMAAIEAILAQAAPSDQSRKISAILARMRDATGNPDSAREIVAKILSEDASNVEALKLRANWAIAEDRAGDAILDLRAAQGQAPRDPQIMTLLAAAFERDGSKDLAAEQLAKAVEASGSGAEESLRYAKFLRAEGRASVAETVLTEARRISPANPAVLLALAEVLLEAKKWPQAQEIADTLRQIGQPDTQQAAERVSAAVLMGQDKMEEGLSLLADQARTAGDDLRPTLMAILTHLRAGKLNEAQAFLAEAMTRTPDHPSLRLLSANIDTMQGRIAEAEATYRALMADLPQSDAAPRMLYLLLSSLGRQDEAMQVLETALNSQPESAALLWIKAGVLEKKGDIDGAIAIYESLYVKDSGNMILANNLASMITSYREDAASLERAAVIARRLRDTRTPAFQDTYGWIEYRRGNLDEALRYLEPAAQGLPEDAVTQVHLALVYADLGRKDEAIALLRKALDLGKDKPLPQLETARRRLEELTAMP